MLLVYLESLLFINCGLISNSKSDKKNPAKQIDDQQVTNHPWLKKLFKKIAMHCHPDKVGNSDHEKMLSYMKARKALDDENEPSMISIGLLYNEVPDIALKQIRKIMTDSISVVDSQVKEKQSDLVWKWGACEDNFSVKAKILVIAAQQMLGKDISQENALNIVMRFFEEAPPVKARVARKVGTRPESLRRRRNDNIH